jgi:hypothetical protein
MKKIADSNILTESRSSAGVSRKKTGDWEDELDSLFRQIYARYSGNLRAFFQDLEAKSERGKTNGIRHIEDRNLVDAK